MLRSFVEGSIFGEQWGSGPAKVLALHGWARTRHDFDAVFDGAPSSLGESGLDAIAIDLPGFGSTPPPPEPWGSAQYAEALQPLLSEMDEQVIVLGHSFGGRVAVRLAVADARVHGLVLSGVPLFRAATAPSQTRLPYRMIRVLRRSGLISEKRLERARKRYGSRDYAMANGVMRDVLVKSVSETYDVDLSAIEQPVTLVWGEHDTVTPLGVAEQASKLLHHATITVAIGAGHLTPLEAPDALRSAVRQLLK